LGQLEIEKVWERGSVVFWTSLLLRIEFRPILWAAWSLTA
jgi:hypothetical protein